MASFEEWAVSWFWDLTVPQEITQVDDTENNGNQQECRIPVDETEEPNANQEPQPLVDLENELNDDKEEPNANQQDAELRIAVDEKKEPKADLENELKFALGLFTASAGSIVAAVVADFKGKIGVPDSVAFHAFVSLNLAALISDSIAILLCLKRPKVSKLARIVQFALCVSSGSLIFADVWAVYLLLTGSTNTK